ncbi:RNA polymerase sigma factor [Streptomyces mirabilis]|uniref:RNA polymerase sigma factor n=1 Tax=Streptomyces mirabilis TaxID=68239 RepID=UPI00365045B5
MPNRPGLGAFETSRKICVLDAEFTQLVTETETRLHWFAYHLCGNRAQAEDLVQSGYLKLWTKWADYRPYPPGHQRALAYSAVKSVFIDYVRVKSNQYAPSDLADYDAVDDSAVDEELIANENAREVLQAVEQLPDRFREVITAVYFDGSTLAAFTESQGLTPKRASRYHIKALQLLREILGER